MTLTALLVKDGNCFETLNPSVRIERGASRSDVVFYSRQLSKNKSLFCPHCYKRSGQKIPVLFRNSQDKRVHFYHQKAEGQEVSECRNWSSESEKHLCAKDAVFYWLQSRDGISDLSAYKEFRLSDSNVQTRQPDIYAVYPNGSSVAIEIQVSPINSLAMSERTRDIQRHGVDSVEWFLYGANFNDENRTWCAKNRVKCFHLWFKDGDITRPDWKQCSGISVKSQPASGNGSDSCSQKSGHDLTEAVELCRWFIECHASNQLPEPPFQLSACQAVTDRGFYDVVARDCNSLVSYSKGERQKPPVRLYGLIQDLEKLKILTTVCV